MSAKTGRAKSGWVVLGFSTVISTAVLMVSFALPAQSGQAAADIARPELADLIEAAQPSVVTISVEKSVRNPQSLNYRGPQRGSPEMDEFFERFFGRGFPMPDAEQRTRGVGSGFIIDADGYIVTNNHVVEDADVITVTLHDGEAHEAELLGADPKTDLALLKIDAQELTAARFGDSDAVRVGDWVVAIGNPFGFGGTATVGIVSARGRDLRAGPYDDFLQIDAPINQGNSGGPVFNMAGEVIGINTAIYSPNGGNVGIGFAIPANQAEEIVAELRNNGLVERGWLGVQLQGMDDALAESLNLDSNAGALVAEVVSGSPAANANVDVGDVIVEFDDEAVDSPKALSRMVGTADSGERIPMKVWRNGKHKTLVVTLGRADQPATIAQGETNDSVGLALAPLDEAARARFGLDDEATGAIITRVQPSSEAARQGLRPGDLIVSVDQREVDSPKDVTSAIEGARRGGQDSVLLLVRRGEAQRFTALALA